MNNENLVESKTNNLPQYCTAPGCTNLINPERVDALDILETPRQNRLCLNCAEINVKPKMAVFLGESGNSPLLFVDKVDNNRIQFESVNRAEKSLTE